MQGARASAGLVLNYSADRVIWILKQEITIKQVIAVNACPFFNPISFFINCLVVTPIMAPNTVFRSRFFYLFFFKPEIVICSQKNLFWKPNVQSYLCVAPMLSMQYPCSSHYSLINRHPVGHVAHYTAINQPPTLAGFSMISNTAQLDT